MRPIHLVLKDELGQSAIRGHQLAPLLARLGRSVRVVHDRDFRAHPPRDSIVVFVKHLGSKSIVLAHRNDNFVVWNVSDLLVFREDIPRSELLDAVLFPSGPSLREHLPFLRAGVHAAVMHGHADPRWAPHTADGFRLGYLGSPTSFFDVYAGVRGLEQELLPNGPQDATTERFFRRARRYSCHFSVRPESRDFRHKPCTKLIGAAASHANIVLSRDPANLELLDPSYPYYTDGDLPRVQETVDRAREDYGTAAWREALAMLEAVRERTTPERIARDYLAFFARMEGQRPGRVRVFLRRFLGRPLEPGRGRLRGSP